MIHNFKYVMAKTDNGNQIVMIFHQNLQHSKVKFWGQETIYNITDISNHNSNYIRKENQSAGFIRYCDYRNKAIAHGESVSLNVKSNEGDTEIINSLIEKFGIDFDNELVLFFVDGEKKEFEPNVTFEDLKND